NLQLEARVERVHGNHRVEGPTAVIPRDSLQSGSPDEHDRRFRGPRKYDLQDGHQAVPIVDVKYHRRTLIPRSGFALHGHEIDVACGEGCDREGQPEPRSKHDSNTSASLCSRVLSQDTNEMRAAGKPKSSGISRVASRRHTQRSTRLVTVITK